MMEGPLSMIVLVTTREETHRRIMPGLFSASAWTFHMTLPSAKGEKVEPSLERKVEPESGEGQ